MRLFADYSSLFTCVEGVDQTHVTILKDLQTILLVGDESTVHYFVCCHRYNILRTTYLSKISDILKSDISAPIRDLPKKYLGNCMGLDVIFPILFLFNNI